MLWRREGARGGTDLRSALGAVEGERRLQRPITRGVRSAAADESAAAYESECEPGGLYGAARIYVRRAFVLALPVRPAG